MSEPEAKKSLKICALGSLQSCHVINRVKCFAERGHDVFFVVSGDNSREEVDNIPVIRLESKANRFPWLLLKPINRVCKIFFQVDLFYVKMFFDMARLLSRHQADVIHIHYAYNPYGWMAGLASDRPVVVSVMGGDILYNEQGSPTPFGKRLTKKLLDRADLILAKSDYLIDVLQEIGNYRSKTRRVIWGVDTSQFCHIDDRNLKKSLGIRAEDRVLLSPKILQPLYRLHLIVEALPKILETFPDIKLIITEYNADTDYKQHIYDLALSIGVLDRLIFVGCIPHDEMPKYYSIADVVIAVPSSDGLPQTLFEAMSCDVPNILSRLPRYEEVVVHRQSAYFVEPTPEGIAEGVIELLQDKFLRESIIRHGKQVVQQIANFSTEVHRVEKEYIDLLEHPRHRSSWKEKLIEGIEISKYFTSIS